MRHAGSSQADYLRRWRTDGYFVVRHFASAAEIKPLKQLCDTVLERKRRASRSMGHTTTHIGLLDPVELGDEPQRLRELLSFLASPRLCALLRELAPVSAGDPWLKTVQYFHEPTVRDWQGAWHRDSQFVRNHVEVRTRGGSGTSQPLSEHTNSDARDEAFERAFAMSTMALRFRVAFLPDDRLELVPGTHVRWDTDEQLAIRKRQALVGLVAPVDPSADVAMPGAERVVLEPGDACVFHAWMIHRGSYVRAPARRTLDGFFRYGRELSQLGWR